MNARQYKVIKGIEDRAINQVHKDTMQDRLNKPNTPSSDYVVNQYNHNLVTLNNRFCNKHTKGAI